VVDSVENIEDAAVTLSFRDEMIALSQQQGDAPWLLLYLSLVCVHRHSYPLLAVLPPVVVNAFWIELQSLL
jgi:hypothetical protein